MRVLVVEDEEKIAQFLKKGLTEKGYTVEAVGDPDSALQRMEAAPFDLLILDLLLPGSRDGLDVCREVRARGIRVKILMLTAQDTIENKIEGLDAGADDYIVKPFSFRELLARLRALTRRTESAEPGPLTLGNLSYDPESREVTRGGEVIRLTAPELSLLQERLAETAEHPLKRIVATDLSGEAREIAEALNTRLDAVASAE